MNRTVPINTAIEVQIKGQNGYEQRATTDDPPRSHLRRINLNAQLSALGVAAPNANDFVVRRFGRIKGQTQSQNIAKLNAENRQIRKDGVVLGGGIVNGVLFPCFRSTGSGTQQQSITRLQDFDTHGIVCERETKGLGLDWTRTLSEINEVEYRVGAARHGRAEQEKAADGVAERWAAAATEMGIGDKGEPVFGYGFEGEERVDGQAEEDLS